MRGRKTIMTVEERVKSIIAAQLNVNKSTLTPNASFTDDLGADSLGLTYLVVDLEDKFNIQIPYEDVEKLTNVQKVIEFIEGRLNNQ